MFFHFFKLVEYFETIDCIAVDGRVDECFFITYTGERFIKEEVLLIFKEELKIRQSVVISLHDILDKFA